MKNPFTGLVLFLAGIALGNLIGDQATIKDCATKSVANMSGGGSVKCEVLRASPPSKEQP